MSNASPLVGIALTVGIPLLMRNSSTFSLALLKPRIQQRAAIRGSPSELLVVFLALAAVAYNLAKLLPWSPSFRLAQDVFRHTGLPIGINSLTLRSRLAARDLADLGLAQLQGISSTDDVAAAEEDVIERLLRRLSSMSGRQMYLLLGAEAVLDCHYCKQPLDLQYFAFPPLLLAYSLQFLLVNVLTASPHILSSLDDLLAPIWPVSSDPRASSQAQRATSFNWRTTATCVLLAALLAEGAVITDSLGWSENQASAWNHWHHNAYIARHLLFALLPLAIYVYPAIQTPSISQTAARLHKSMLHVGANIHQSTSNVSVLEAGRQAVWRDPGMRSAVQAWYTADAEKTEADERLLHMARHKGLLPDNASAKVRQTVQQQLAAVKTADAV